METSSWFERWDICGTSYAPFPVELMQQASGATLSPSMPRVVALKITAHLRGLGAWKWTWPRASVETDV
jgi:hypothetical protein